MFVRKLFGIIFITIIVVLSEFGFLYVLGEIQAENIVKIDENQWPLLAGPLISVEIVLKDVAVKGFRYLP